MAQDNLRILILGGSGMLGHKLWQCWRGEADTFVTVRRPLSARLAPLFDPSRTLTGVDASRLETVARVIDQVKPTVIINGIGIVKQRKEAQDPAQSIRINALFPHQLKEFCQKKGIRQVQISTDCVFSGKSGNYREGDLSDAEDLYGRTKYLGEVSGPGCLTLRTSIIGRELENRLGLVEWFLSQKGKTVRGYTRAVYTGLTTSALARILLAVLRDFPPLSGICHVASQKISKYELLKKIRAQFSLDTEIQPFDDYFCDRSLDATRFLQTTGLQIPSWDEMIQELAIDSESQGEIYET